MNNIRKDLKEEELKKNFNELKDVDSIIIPDKVYIALARLRDVLKAGEQ